MASTLYNWTAIQGRANAIIEADYNEDLRTMQKLLRSSLVRNMGGITNPRLFNRLFAGTKTCIEQYVQLMVNLLDAVVSHTPSTQGKMYLLDGARRSFGRTALVLQGGSIFGLCHIGVMRALYLRGLLPRIILGTSTGALMAALVGIHTDEELPNFLNGTGIDLSAFHNRDREDSDTKPEWFEIFFTRFWRFAKSGYVLDRDALERCVEANVGDTTFEEAFNRTGRMLSIAISCDIPGTPNCLNYLTAPNVLIRSAAMASSETDPDVAPGMILETDARGQVQNWALNDETPAFRDLRRRLQRPSANDRKTPLHRVSELFNVNHFIISQARPYLMPFVAPSLHRSNLPKDWMQLKELARRTVGGETRLRMRQWDIAFAGTWLQLWPSLRRFLLDEMVHGPTITLVPEVKWADFKRLLRNPTTEEVKYWVSVGENSVWPCVSALRVRCDIELALEDHYQDVRRVPRRTSLQASGSGTPGA